MKILVTGAAGFIGSNFCDFLLTKGFSVIGVDNFSTGQREFLTFALSQNTFKLFEADILNQQSLIKLFCEEKPEWVFHFAANADVRFGLNHPQKDLEQNTIGTFNVLEACRLAGVKKIAFTSTGSVYGEPNIFPTPENYSFPIQTSLYGASKLAGEGLIQAYAEGYGLKGYIFRLVSILGERYTHGHIYDFVKKLLKDPTQLEVLGNGKQQKGYFYIGDCVGAMLHVISTQEEKINIFNLGPNEFINVDQSLDVICKIMKVNPKRLYQGGERGWIGDSPFIFLDNKKLVQSGFLPKVEIRDGVAKTVRYLLDNPSVLMLPEKPANFIKNPTEKLL